MTLHLTVTAPASPQRDRRTKFHPRSDILDEVVAGLLWLQLNLPDDVSRDEVESHARRLVTRIRGNAGQDVIESELTVLQSVQFCRPADHAAIRELARRSVQIVRAA